MIVKLQSFGGKAVFGLLYLCASCRVIIVNDIGRVPAGRVREPGQAGNRAAISGTLAVLWVTRPSFDYYRQRPVNPYGLYSTGKKISLAEVR